MLNNTSSIRGSVFGTRLAARYAQSVVEKAKPTLVSAWMTSEVITVSPTTTLADAQRAMSARQIRCLPVVKDGILVGIVTRRGLLRAAPSNLLAGGDWKGDINLSNRTLSEIMTSPVITISVDAPVGKAARTMMENKFTCMPVVNRDRQLVGIFTTTDLFRMIAESIQLEGDESLVRAWMTPEVATLTPEDSLIEAHRIMGIKRVRSLPVVKEGALVGIVTRTDLMASDPSRLCTRGEQDKSADIESQPVERMMTRNPQVIREDEEIRSAAQRMLENKFHSLPVVNAKNEMVGIITESDLFQIVVQKGF